MSTVLLSLHDEAQEASAVLDDFEVTMFHSIHSLSHGQVEVQAISLGPHQSVQSI